MTERTLFGRPGDEVLYDSAAEVYETYEDEFLEGEPGQLVIEEWSITPASSLLPRADVLIEWMLERWIAEEITADGWDSWENQGMNPEVVAAFQGALDLLASKIHYCTADKLLHEHAVSFVDGEPYLDGEPMYVKHEEQT